MTSARRRTMSLLMAAAVGGLPACGAMSPDGGDTRIEQGASSPATGVLDERRLGRHRWDPEVGQSWQWQLTGDIDTSVEADVYDVDLFDTPESTVRGLRAQGREVICYLSAGSYEPWRPDSDDFPASVLGDPLDGFEDERWLDIRQLDVLLPIMARRMDLCRAKGFRGVEPDNVDGYANDSGFPLTAQDQLRYNLRLADLAHDRRLAVGLKNDLDQVEQLVSAFDFAVNEQCAQYRECDRLTPFIAAGKPVFHVEYELSAAQFCPVTRPLSFSSLAKDEDLGPALQRC